MAINKYFQTNQPGISSEQTVLKNLVAESIQQMGVDVQYIPRTLVSEDRLLHEDPSSSFDASYTIEAYIESMNAFGGDSELLTKFGLTNNDEVELTFSVIRFQQETGMTHPVEGDLIYFKQSNTLFEIKYMEDEDPFYQLGTLPSFKVTAESFQFSHQNFNTGIAEVDDILNSNIDDIFDDSDTLQTEGDAVLDFSESNPFGNF